MAVESQSLITSRAGKAKRDSAEAAKFRRPTIFLRAVWTFHMPILLSGLPSNDRVYRATRAYTRPIENHINLSNSIIVVEVFVDGREISGGSETLRSN